MLCHKSIRAWTLSVVVALLVSGCTGETPAADAPSSPDFGLIICEEDCIPGDAGDARVELVASTSQAVPPGELVRFRLLMHGGDFWPETYEIHYGYESVPEPEPGAYPTIVSIEYGFDELAVPMSANGLFARALLFFDGDETWTHEVRIEAADGGYTFHVSVPEQVEAGVDFALGVDVTGQGGGPIMLSIARSAASTLDFMENWEADRERLAPVFASEVNIPMAGTWFVRPYLLADEWRWDPIAAGEAVLIQVFAPETPNLRLLEYWQEPPECFDMATVCADVSSDATLAVNAAGGTLEVTLVAFEHGASSADPSSGTVVGGPAVLPPGRAVMPFMLPPGSWSVLAYANHDGSEVWSNAFNIHAVE